MEPKNGKQYLESKVLSASPEELLIMLLDGAIGFAQQGRQKMQEGDLAAAHEFLIKAQRIAMELLSALRRDLLPEELYRRLGGLYLFVYRRLVEANIRKKPELIGESLQILGHLKETFARAIEKNRQAGIMPQAVREANLDLNV